MKNKSIVLLTYQHINILPMLKLSFAKFNHYYSQIEAFNGRESIEYNSKLQNEYEKRNPDVCILSTEDDEYVGFYCYHYCYDTSSEDNTRTVNLWLLGIRDKFKGQGYGKKLFEHFMNTFSNDTITCKTNKITRPAMYHMLTYFSRNKKIIYHNNNWVKFEFELIPCYS